VRVTECARARERKACARGGEQGSHTESASERREETRRLRERLKETERKREMRKRGEGAERRRAQK